MMLYQKKFRCAYSHSQMHELNLIQEIVDICVLCFPSLGDLTSTLLCKTGNVTFTLTNSCIEITVCLCLSFLSRLFH